MARTKDMCYALTENVGGNTGDIKVFVEYKGKKLTSESIKRLSELFKEKRRGNEEIRRGTVEHGDR